VRVLLPLLAGARADPALAAGSARGLGWCGDRGALEELEEALHGDAAEVAVAAAWALGNIGDASSADALAEQGVKGPGRAAVAAVSALEAMPAAPSVGVALCEIAVRSQDPAAASRAAAAAHARDAECPDRALAQRLSRGGPEALPALAALGALHLPPERRKASAERAMGLLQSSSDARIRTAAVRALGLAPHPSAVPLLQRRGQAAVAREDREAGGAGGKGTARPGPDAPGRDELAEIVVALARLDAGASFSLAHRLSRDEDPALRAAAAEAIGIAKPPDALARLGSLAQDGSPAVRAAALQSLGALGAPAVPPLSATLASSRDPDEVATVVRALAATGDATAVPAIAPMLSGPVAGPAASALGRLGGPAAAKALLGTLQRSQAAGRIEVVDALAALGPPETGEALARELLSDRPEVRAAAARGLGKIRHEAAAGRLEALRSDYYADVRRAAVEALARLPARAAPARP
jgi:HEAT repeat protein